MAAPRSLFLQWRLRHFVLLLTLLPALWVPVRTVASERAPPAGPPLSYRLDTVELRLQRQPGHGQPKLALVVAGAGSATLESGRPASARGFTLPADEVLALLNGLYRLRFFDLPAALRARQSVLLMPDGAIATQVTNRIDTASTTVCVALPGFEKCVRYAEGDGPPELEGWVQAAFADAQRRAVPASPVK